MSGAGPSTSGGHRDVVVVGAGPAGALAARQLAAAGLDVLLVERQRLGRDKVCGGCLHPRAVELLRALGMCDVLDATEAAPLTRLELASGGRRASARTPLGVAVDRVRFDRALVAAAAGAGATVCAATTARLEQDHAKPGEDGPRRLRVGDGAVTADLVLAADGLASPVLAVDQGPARARPDAHVGAGTWLAGDTVDDQELPPGTVVMAVGHDGYVGRVRLPDGRVDLAAALSPRALSVSRGAGALASRLLRESRAPGLAAVAADATWHLTPPLTRTPARPWSRRVLAVGDAAGYVEPFTGEGMAWALSGADAAARLVLAARRDGRPWNDLGPAWSREVTRRLGRSRRRCALVAAALRRPWAVRAAVALLTVSPGLGRRLVSQGHGG